MGLNAFSGKSAVKITKKLGGLQKGAGPNEASRKGVKYYLASVGGEKRKNDIIQERWVKAVINPYLYMKLERKRTRLSIKNFGC